VRLRNVELFAFTHRSIPLTLPRDITTFYLVEHQTVFASCEHARKGLDNASATRIHRIADYLGTSQYRPRGPEGSQSSIIKRKHTRAAMAATDGVKSISVLVVSNNISAYCSAAHAPSFACSAKRTDTGHTQNQDTTMYCQKRCPGLTEIRMKHVSPQFRLVTPRINPLILNLLRPVGSPMLHENINRRLRTHGSSVKTSSQDRYQSLN
jgi:hypothetical protein